MATIGMKERRRTKTRRMSIVTESSKMITKKVSKLMMIKNDTISYRVTCKIKFKINEKPTQAAAIVVVTVSRSEKQPTGSASGGGSIPTARRRH